MDELSLIQGCIEGNQRAQRKLFDSFSPKFFAVCLRYMKNNDEAEDVLQDAMIKVFSKLPEYSKKGSFEGWMRRIVVNTCLDQIRKNHKFQDNVDIDQVDYKIVDNGFIVEGLMAEDLMLLINTMPDGYRTVFNMFAIEGYSHKEIAKELGVTENTSKSQYSRARAYLKTKLEEEDFER